MCAVVRVRARVFAASGQGAGFIEFARNDIAWVSWAGVYLAQESSYHTYGSFDLRVADPPNLYDSTGKGHTLIFMHTATYMLW